VLRPEEQRVVLLVLRSPDLEHRQGLVAHRDVAHLDPRPRRFDDLLEHVAVTACSLVVYAHDRVVVAELHACAQHTVHLLLHLGVTALHGVEVELGHVLTLHHARRGSASHADPVGGTADLHDPHSHLGRVLIGVASVDLADPPTEHDRLDPLASLSARNAQAEGTRVPLDYRLAELVAVVRGPVRRLDLDLEWRRQVRRVGETRVLPGELVAGNAQVPHAVSGRARHDQRTLPGRVDVTDPAAGARLGPGEGRHPGREIVRLGGEDDVVIRFSGDHATRLAGPFGHERSDRVTSNTARIVLEGDDAVARIGVQGCPEHFHQVLRGLDSVDHQATLEEPVTRVLAVGLRDVEQLHVRRIAADTLGEQARVIPEVPVIEGQAHFAVHALEGGASFGQDGNGANGVRSDSVLEGVERRRVGALGHPVVHFGEEAGHLILDQVYARLEQVAPRTLDAANAVQVARVADRHGVGRPGRREAQARTHLEQQTAPGAASQILLGRPVQKEGLPAEAPRLKRLGEQPGQRPEIALRGLSLHLHVETVLGPKVDQVAGDAVPHPIA
jgi:hypothetical protein